MSMQAASLEVLEKANVPAPQARAIVQAIEIEIAGSQNVLATKQDILAVKQDVHAVEQDVHAVELKIEVIKSDVLRHLYTAILGQTALLLGLAYFFVTHLQH